MFIPDFRGLISDKTYRSTTNAVWSETERGAATGLVG